MRNEKYSLAHLSMIEETIFNLIKIANIAGYDYVSPRIHRVTSSEEVHKLVGDSYAIKECQRILSDSNVGVLDIELLAIKDDTDVIKEFTPVLDAAAQINAQYAITQIYCTTLEMGVEKFIQLEELAQSYNIVLVLEMVPWSSLSDIHTTHSFINDTHTNTSGILLDLLHLYRTNTPPESLKNIDDKYLHFIHLCDARGKGIKSVKGQIHVAREARYPAGRGDIAVLNYLDNIGTEVFSLEVPNERMHRHLGSMEYAQYILQDTKNYLLLEECWRVKSLYKSVPSRLI